MGVGERGTLLGGGRTTTVPHIERVEYGYAVAVSRTEILDTLCAEWREQRGIMEAQQTCTHKVELIDEDQTMKRPHEVHRRVIRAPVRARALPRRERPAEHRDKLQRFASLLDDNLRTHVSSPQSLAHAQAHYSTFWRRTIEGVCPGSI